VLADADQLRRDRASLPRGNFRIKVTCPVLSTSATQAVSDGQLDTNGDGETVSALLRHKATQAVWCSLAARY